MNGLLTSTPVRHLGYLSPRNLPVPRFHLGPSRQNPRFKIIRRGYFFLRLLDQVGKQLWTRPEPFPVRPGMLKLPVKGAFDIPVPINGAEEH